MKYQCSEHPGHLYDDEPNIWISVCPFCSAVGEAIIKVLKKKYKFPFTFKATDYEYSNYDGSGGKTPRRQGCE